MAWMSVAIFCCEISLLALLFPYLMTLIVACTPPAIVSILKSDALDPAGVGVFVASILFGIRGWGRYIHRNAPTRLVSENAKLFERMAMEDVLTELPNRRSFERTFAATLAEGSGRVALLMIDVDHFKRINDGYSHEIGDHVLQGIAEVLRSAVGDAGVAARLAGDEFVVGLFGLEHDEESRKIGSVEIAMATCNWERLAPALVVTVSLGLARAEVGDTLADMLRRGDQQMYMHKRASRITATGQMSSANALGADVP
jgi:diguanylate cyclase (GGDEF)-like protein